MVYSRLSRRLRDKKMTGFTQYLDFLERGDQTEWQEFVNALTTNLTSFFREKHHFEILRDFLQAFNGSRKVNIWCGAASTGEEPYSIAITSEEVLGSNKVNIFASDIDSRVLDTARNGIYRSEQLNDVSDILKKKYFLKGKKNNIGSVRVKTNLSKDISFLNINLICDIWPFRESFDVVFCRNVMIYFDAMTQRKVLEKIHSVLLPGGLLFVGHAENFSDSKDLFSLRGKTVYERI